MSRMYRFNNLMVNVGEDVKPQTNLCFGTKWCRYPTMACVFGTCGLPSPCAFGSCGYRSPIVECPNQSGIVCPGNSRIDPTEILTRYTDIFENPVVQVQQLAALKQELKQALAEIEVQERAMAEAQMPKTLEEVQAVQVELEQAMKEVEALKHKMTKAK